MKGCVVLFDVVYHLEVGIEPRKGSPIDGVDLECKGTIPFAPTEGLFLIPVKDDDYRKIDMVQWDGNRFDVYCEYDDNREGRAVVKDLKKLGWKETACAASA